MFAVDRQSDTLGHRALSHIIYTQYTFCERVESKKRIKRFDTQRTRHRIDRVKTESWNSVCRIYTAAKQYRYYARQYSYYCVCAYRTLSLLLRVLHFVWCYIRSTFLFIHWYITLFSFGRCFCPCTCENDKNRKK